ncbi:MAG TPA: hypothetical protein VF884_07060, partial [Nitrososphaeraceae archaeon]
MAQKAKGPKFVQKFLRLNLDQSHSPLPSWRHKNIYGKDTSLSCPIFSPLGLTSILFTKKTLP